MKKSMFSHFSIHIFFPQQLSKQSCNDTTNDLLYLGLYSTGLVSLVLNSCLDIHGSHTVQQCPLLTGYTQALLSAHATMYNITDSLTMGEETEQKYVTNSGVGE